MGLRTRPSDFIEQDEDLVLHDVQYVAVMIELAADANCPKNEDVLSTLSNYSQLTVLFREVDVATAITKLLDSSPHRNNPRISRWANYFRSIYDRLVQPRSLSDAEMKTLAKQLLNGQYSLRSFERTGRIVNRFHEFVAYTDSYRGYVYINPNTGKWQQSRYKELTQILE